jgi:uncharacterized membrane protein
MSPQPQSRLRRISLYAIATLFIGAGAAHFTHEAFFVRIVPPVLPNPRRLVQLSGLADIASRAGLYLRLPLQFLGMFWVRWATAPQSAPS